MKKNKSNNPNCVKNLISLADRSIEERKAISAKAVMVRKANAAKRRTVQEIADAILKIEGNDLTDVLDNKALQAKAESLDLSIYDVLMLKMVDQGLKGSVKAFETVRDSVGDKPVTKQETSVNIINESDNSLLHKIADRLGIETADVIDADFSEL